MSQSDVTIRPPFRGGSVARFHVRPLHAVQGSAIVHIDGQRFVPRYGTLSVNVGITSIVSPLGHTGEFFRIGLDTGRYPAQIRYAVGVCGFVLVVPQRAGIANVGRLNCGDKPADSQTP